MLITSVNNDKIKELVKLKEKKERDRTGLFFVEGMDLICEAYKSGLLEKLYIVSGNDSPYDDIDTVYVSSEVMKKISDMESISNYFGVCKKKGELPFGNKIIILDGLQDAGNVGTIIRSASAFNFDTVVLSKDTVDLYNPKVVRSTKGMIFNKNIIVRDLVEFLNQLNDYKIYGTDVVNGINIRNEKLPSKLVIVIGNEGRGISPDVRKLCNEFLYIPMNDNCESLNASVSASILMYEVSSK